MIKSILYLCKYRFQLALKCVLSLSIASFIRQTEIANQSNSHINKGARNHLSTILWYFKRSRFSIIILSIQWLIRWNQNRSILNLPWKNRIGEDRGIFVFRRSSKHFVFLKYLFTYEIKNYILYVIRIFLKHHISENHLNQIIL